MAYVISDACVSCGACEGKVQPSSVINAWYSSISVSFRYFVKGSAYARNFMNIPGARKISSRPVTKP